MTNITLDSKKLQACIHCGLCLEACPTYLETGEEMSSPRGRLYLMKALEDGTIAASDESFQKHELSCLVCRSCETACPSGVEFGYLMEQTRAIIRKESPKEAHSFLFTKVIGNKPLTALAQVSTSILSKLQLGKGLSGVMNTLGLKRLASSLSIIPKSVPLTSTRQSVYSALSQKKGDIGILVGCIGDVFTSKINDSTISVLRKLGYDVHTLPEITCCGSLAIHEGYHDHAVALARENVGTVLASKVDFFISNIAGCGANLKNYGVQLGTTEAHEFRKKVFDISEFLYKYHYEELREMLGESKQTIGYHSPCHLLHGQKIKDEPVDLLKLIQGTNVIALEENDICCGSAGVYNIEHPDMGDALLARKVAIIRRATPDIVATGNAGCQMQLQKGTPTTPVKHVIEILAERL
jgi:glycolate oxidase iron-sulfur subunit